MNLLIGVHDKEVKDQREERVCQRKERKGEKKKKKCQVNYGVHEQPRKKKKKGEQMKKMYFTRRNSSD